MYFGSLADTRPIELYPDYDWIFITPEPNHPVAVAQFPPECHGYQYLHGTFLVDEVMRRLKDWECTGTETNRWEFSKGACQRLTMFPNSAVGGAQETLSDAAKAAIVGATVLYVHGFLPAFSDVKRLCPLVRTLIACNNHLASERRLGNIKYEYVPLQEYDWDDRREEYIFFTEPNGSDSDEEDESGAATEAVTTAAPAGGETTAPAPAKEETSNPTVAP